MEELQANMKKKAKPPPRLTQLEDIVTVHKKHTDCLEKTLRCLDNDAVEPEEVDALRDDMDYYLVRQWALVGLRRVSMQLAFCVGSWRRPVDVGPCVSEH